MMADNQLLLEEDNVGGDDLFVYTGGEQEVPRDVERVRMAENVDTIPGWTFAGCRQLIEVEGHNKLKKIERRAFQGCRRLRSVTNMQGVIEIEHYAFYGCFSLSEFDFVRLEIIGINAFSYCNSLESVNMPSIRRVGADAFNGCKKLTSAVTGQNVERIEMSTFFECTALRSIAIPLKYNLIIANYAFYGCEILSRVHILAGEIHATISSLHMESWRDQMLEEIDSINQTLPTYNYDEKSEAIQQWSERVLQRMEHYKSEHKKLLKEAMTLLELVLWKAKLLNEADEKKCKVDVVKTKKAKVDTEAAKKEHRVTCGASVVIKNVLPFLALK